MKRTLYIESIDRKIDGQPGRWYTPIYHHSDYIFRLIEKCNVSCENVDQISDRYWHLKIKGKKKNMRLLITNLAVAVAGVYNIREYD